MQVKPAAWVSAAPFWRRSRVRPSSRRLWRCGWAREGRQAGRRQREHDQREQRSGPDEFFRRYFGEPRQGGPGNRSRQSLGSGFIASADGHVVTNFHVVRGASEIVVRLADHSEHKGRLVGSDPKTDIALLKIDDASSLATLPFGDSDRLQVGEPVMAIGNPFGLEQTVTTGIVSAKERFIGAGPYDDFIQTDASINPGNSGGPLIDARGALIGINSAIFSQSGGSVGIGFAIPVNIAKDVLPQLRESGRVTRGYLGVAVVPVSPEVSRSLGVASQRGVVVAEVVPRSRPPWRGSGRATSSSRSGTSRSRVPASSRDGSAARRPAPRWTCGWPERAASARSAPRSVAWPTSRARATADASVRDGRVDVVG